MNRKIQGIAGTLAFLAMTVPSNAYWVGNPAQPLETGKGNFEVIYDMGERDIKNTSGGPATELDSRRLLLQGQVAVAKALQVVGRGLPGTGRLNLENRSFNPHLWGFGVGLRFAPPEAIAERVHLGAVAMWDWNFGRTDPPPTQTGHDKINWAEGTIAAGASVNVVEMLDVYGGATFVKPDIHLDLGGVETNLEADTVFGGFAGVSVMPNEAWRLGLELHFGNENTAGFNLGYTF